MHWIGIVAAVVLAIPLLALGALYIYIRSGKFEQHEWEDLTADAVPDEPSKARVPSS